MEQVIITREQTRYVNIALQAIQQNGSVVANCNDIAFINLGASVVTINNVLPLAQYGSFNFTGNKNEYDTTQYMFTFDSDPDKNLIVVRKNFQDNEL